MERIAFVLTAVLFTTLLPLLGDQGSGVFPPIAALAIVVAAALGVLALGVRIHVRGAR